MTEIIFKKRKILTLNKAPAKKENTQPELTGKQRGEEHNQRQKKETQRQYLACNNWIFRTWPGMFDKKNVKPFAIGTLEQIKAKYDKQGGFDVLGFYRNAPLKKVISGWTHRKAYQRALIADGALRYSLSGESIGPVSDMDKKSAVERLEALKRGKLKK